MGAIQAQSAGTASPEILTNDKVIGMIKAGLSPNLIVTTINGNGCGFKLDTDNLITLKQAHIPDEVLRAMLLKNCQATAGVVRDPARGAIQGTLTWESKVLGHTAENGADILLLKAGVEIPGEVSVMVTGKNLAVSAPADAACTTAMKALDDVLVKVVALAKCSRPGFDSIKNQTAAHLYEILERTAPDENGHFEIINIKPGQYTLLIRSTGPKGLTSRDMLGKWFGVQVGIEGAKTFDASHNFGATEY